MRARKVQSRWSIQPSREPSREPLPLIGLLGGILLAAAIAALCFLYLWQGNRIQILTAANEEVRAKLDAELEINHILAIRIDEAFSLERIARIARDQLHMSEPTDVLYVPIPTPTAN